MESQSNDQVEQQIDAKSRTRGLKRTFLPVDQLEGNDKNPNEMSDQQFNLLYDNIERMGVTDPILVKPTENGRFRIVGGHHRWEVAKLVGLDEVPVTIITDPKFDEDAEKFQVVLHNIIKGRMNAKKFMDLYASLSTKYSDDVASEMFGFTSEDEFKKMVAATGKSLPPEMQETYKKATKEIKTIDDLAKVLNKLFTEHGDTMPWGFMIFDFGGHHHVWVRMSAQQKAQFLTLCDWCREQKHSVDQVIGAILQLIPEGKLDQIALAQKLNKLPEVNTEQGKLPVETVQFSDHLS